MSHTLTTRAEAASTELLAGRYEVGPVRSSTALTLVHRGRDVQLDREVAVTLLRDEFAHDEASAGLFDATISVRAELSHPGIIGVYDAGQCEFGGRAVRWAVGEAVDAPNLDEFEPTAPQAERWGPLMLGLAEQVATAMQHAHGDGAVHGNLGPSTVLLDGSSASDGAALRARITGFGPQAADLAVPSNPVITQRMWQAFTEQLEYPSPEQRAGRAPTRRSDIYGFGCVLAALLLHAERARGCGGGVAGGDSRAAADGVSRAAARADDIARQALAGVAEQAMSEKPGDRQHSFAVVRDQLRWIRAADPRFEGVDLGGDQAVGFVEQTHTMVLPPVIEGPAEPAPATEKLTYLSGMGTGSGTGSGRQSGSGSNNRRPSGASLSASRSTPSSGRGRGGIRRRSPGGWLFAGLAAIVLVVAGLGWGINQANSDAANASVTIPLMVGQELAAATTQLGSLGLSLGGQVQRPDATVPTGLVAATEPAAGSQVALGESVMVVISSGPDARAVPQLQGLTLAAAQDALTAAGLVAGAVLPRDGLSVAGSVLDSDPAFGTPVAAGSVVEIVVSSGNQRVPGSLIGQAGGAASQQLASAGLAPQLLSTPRSDVATGVVVDVVPGAGSSLPLGSIVTLVVSEYTPEPAPANGNAGGGGTGPGGGTPATTKPTVTPSPASPTRPTTKPTTAPQAGAARESGSVGQRGPVRGDGDVS